MKSEREFGCLTYLFQDWKVSRELTWYLPLLLARVKSQPSKADDNLSSSLSLFEFVSQFFLCENHCRGYLGNTKINKICSLLPEERKRSYVPGSFILKLVPLSRMSLLNLSLTFETLSWSEVSGFTFSSLGESQKDTWFLKDRAKDRTDKRLDSLYILFYYYP